MSSVRPEERKRVICSRRLSLKTSDAGCNVLNILFTRSNALGSGRFGGEERGGRRGGKGGGGKGAGAPGTGKEEEEGEEKGRKEARMWWRL